MKVKRVYLVVWIDYGEIIHSCFVINPNNQINFIYAIFNVKVLMIRLRVGRLVLAGRICIFVHYKNMPIQVC